MNISKSFIIHLERATKRRAQAQRLAAALAYDCEIISAIDGNTLSQQQAAQYTPRMIQPHMPGNLRLAEVATFLSHRKCWQRIVDDGLEAALIFEDDVAAPDTDFHNAVELATSHMQQGDFVRFPPKRRDRPYRVIATEGICNLFEPKIIGLTTAAQIVTHAAAKQLLEKTIRFDRPVDSYLQMRWHHDTRILTVWPSGINEVSASLGGSTIGSKKPLTERLNREVARPIYRAKIAVFSHIHNWRRSSVGA